MCKLIYIFRLMYHTRICQPWRSLTTWFFMIFFHIILMLTNGWHKLCLATPTDFQLVLNIFVFAPPTHNDFHNLMKPLSCVVVQRVNHRHSRIIHNKQTPKLSSSRLSSLGELKKRREHPNGLLKSSPRGGSTFEILLHVFSEKINSASRFSSSFIVLALNYLWPF